MTTTCSQLLASAVRLHTRWGTFTIITPGTCNNVEETQSQQIKSTHHLHTKWLKENFVN